VIIMRVLLCLLVLLSIRSYAEVYIPEALEPWRQWVLETHPEQACSKHQHSGEALCTWLQHLSFDVETNGAGFRLSVHAQNDAWIPLPGDALYWPTNVLDENGQALAVSAQAGNPGLRLTAGQYQISGRIPWQEQPRNIPIPADVALLELRLNGEQVRNPVIGDGVLWLERRAIEHKSTERDSVSAKVFRRVRDGNPMLVTTVLEISVSGAERAMSLGPMQLPGFRTRILESELPARVEENGMLRLQIKPGQYAVYLESIASSPVSTMSFKSMGEGWPEQEIWFFEAQRHIRSVQIEGVNAFDVSSIELPVNWSSLPAYLVEENSQFTLKEIHRGDPNPPTNNFVVDRSLWLDFSGENLTAIDNVYGNMHQDWRLELGQPFTLGRVEIANEPQLITKLSDEGDAGVEIRSSRLEMNAVSQLERTGNLPISGWSDQVSRVETNIHLPPAWSVLYVSGAESVRGSWLEKWSLWDIFLVLIIAVSIAKVINPTTGLLALATLVLTYHRIGAPAVLWLCLIAMLALLRVAVNRWAGVVSIFISFFFLITFFTLLPFIVNQARYAMYPQLDDQQYAGSFGDNFLIGTASAPTPEAPSYYSDEGFSNFPDVSHAEALQRAEGVAIREMAAEQRQQVKKSYVVSYDSNQKVQAGPGLPNWEWKNVYASWDGPIAAQESTRIIFVSPFWNRLGYIFAVLLSLALFAQLTRHFISLKPWRIFGKAPNVSAAVLPLILGVSLGASDPAQANVVVDQAVLEELERRLTAPPVCLPNCTSIESISVAVSGEALVLRMRVHSSDDIAFALPYGLAQWSPSYVSINAQKNVTLGALHGNAYAQLSPGRHSIEIAGNLQGRESLTLSFAQPLHNVSVEAEGWSVSGQPTKNRQSSALQLNRLAQVAQNSSQKRLLPRPIKPFLKVSRHISLANEWHVQTVVERIAPSQGVINAEIPLLPGEALITGELNADAKVQVQLSSGENSFEWESVLAITDSISLTAPQEVNWVEHWTLNTSALWHSDIVGIPAIQRQAGASDPEWLPWPGEQLNISVTRPLTVPGEQVAVDSAKLFFNPAKRYSDISLSLDLRATQGAQIPFPLVDNAELKAVRIDGSETPMSHTGGVINIPVKPGRQNIQIDMQVPVGLGVKTQTPDLVLPLPLTNITTEVSVPSDRWILAVGGPRLGPAVLYWSLLTVVLLLAVALARSRYSPLKIYEWVLLTLGIASYSLAVLVLMAAWLALLKIRGEKKEAPASSGFNLAQVGLYILSVITLLSLLGSIPYSLLAEPDMYIEGYQSYGHRLSWFEDKSAGNLSHAWVVSLPMWVYRVSMLLWALWLAFALMRWIPWAWAQLGHLGFWYKAPPRQKRAKVKAE
jgi:hypothetical protein